MAAKDVNDRDPRAENLLRRQLVLLSFTDFAVQELSAATADLYAVAALARRFRLTHRTREGEQRLNRIELS